MESESVLLTTASFTWDGMTISDQKQWSWLEDFQEEVATAVPTDVSGSSDEETELVDLDPQEGALRGQILLSMLSDFEAKEISSQECKPVSSRANTTITTSDDSGAWSKRTINAPRFTPSCGLTSSFGKADLKIDHFKSSLAAMVQRALGEWCCEVHQNADGLRIELQKSEVPESWSDATTEAYAKNNLHQALNVLEQSIWANFEHMVVSVTRNQESAQLLIHVISASEQTGLCWEFAQGYCPRHNRCRWIHPVPSLCVVDVAYS
eukprot:gnl/MRDRNA2_/MRDRNA2_72196_c0_seq1.p1 gnl/MRDRNA2_/MRDRNA2_72196_c0~~gnl/MRDRNA2_/MRDRNA2_72196_c0_seq1.p1  ORF type:complete len:265 (+),score=46.64 gnl/MRDRNA2_/MRDRNA2_72196_c0_seq1:111-905(+)